MSEESLENPMAMVNMVPEKMRENILALPMDLMTKSEGRLKLQIDPDIIDNALRASFWIEYERVICRGGGKMAMVNVFAGVCSNFEFYTRCQDQGKLAWYVRPIPSYQKSVEAGLSVAMQRKQEILSMSIMKKDKDGKELKDWCPKKAQVVLDVAKDFENRARGMAIQRTVKRVEKVDMKSIPASFEDTSDLQKQIERLEREVKGKGVIIDAEDGDETKGIGIPEEEGANASD